MTRATWILESDVFPDSHSPLRAAVVDAGHRLLDWDDAWWANGLPSDLAGANTFFHGSLGNAARINDELDWKPGSFCTLQRFAALRGTTLPANGCSTLIGDSCPPTNSLPRLPMLPHHLAAPIAFSFARTVRSNRLAVAYSMLLR